MHLYEKYNWRSGGTFGFTSYFWEAYKFISFLV